MKSDDKNHYLRSSCLCLLILTSISTFKFVISNLPVFYLSNCTHTQCKYILHNTRLSGPLDIKIFKWNAFEPERDKKYNKTCATSEDSDQPAHSRSLIRVFAGRMCLLQPPSYPKTDKREPLPYLVNEQAELNLSWLHRSFFMFCHALAHLWFALPCISSTSQYAWHMRNTKNGLPLIPGPEVIKLFSCSTQLSMKFVLLTNLKLLKIAHLFLLNIAEHESFSANKYENANYYWHFHIY